MTDEVISISGVKETQAKLYGFSNKLGDRITMLALRSGANYMLRRVRAAAPKDSGRLRKAIVVKTSKIHKPRKDGKVGVYLAIRKGRKGAFYGRFQELGWSPKGKSSSVKGQYFIRNTYNTTKRQSLRLIVRNIETAGLRLAKNL